jgi:hypothetical protein
MRDHTDHDDGAVDARRRIRAARAVAEAAMEDRREAVRADFEQRVRELDDRAAADRPNAA